MPHVTGTVGAHGPIKPFEFFTESPANPPAQTAIDDGSDGWDGLASTFGQTAVAIAASLALTVSMTAAAQQPYIQDELPQQATVVDDIQWQNPTFPIAPSWNIQQFLVDTDYIPQISVDEQYRVEPVQPVAFESDWTTPLIFTDPDYPPQIGVDESPWQNPVQPFSPAWNQQVTFYDSDPLPSLVDEVYWFYSTPFNQPSWNIQLSQPDIDYVPPIAATVVDEIYALPLPSSVPGADWFTQPVTVDGDYTPQISIEEQFWQNPVIPVPPQANLQSPVPLDADYLPQITVDEQYWINPVKPQVPGADWTYQPPPVEDDYLPSLSIDDTPWVNPVAPVAPQWNAQPPTAPDADYIPQIAVSDDVWQNPIAPPGPGADWNKPLVTVDEQRVTYVAPPLVPEEIYWINHVKPTGIENIPLQQWTFDEWGLPIAPSVTTSFVVWLNDD